MSSEFDLESFSRIGKSLSNASSLRSIRESLESSKQQTRSSKEIRFVSLSDTNSQIVDFHVDRGRNALMLSSPRSDSQDKKSLSPTRNSFQRLVSLEHSSGTRATKLRKRQPDRLLESGGISQRGSRQLDSKPPKEKAVAGSSSFLAPERNDSVYYKMQDKRYSAVPPIGHYDASYELVRPKAAKLCYIARRQPNVRTVSPQGHFNMSEGAFTRSKSFEGALTSASKSMENELTRSPDNLRMDEERLVISPQERVPQVAMSESPGPELDSSQREPSRDFQESISQVSYRRGYDPSEVQPSNAWLRPDNTLDFSKTSGRFVGGRALIAGYLAMSRKESFDLLYSPSVEILEITKRHTPTPDLSRSGRDYNDTLERLGYVPPERTAATPYYPKAADPISWDDQRSWFHATHPNNNKSSVNMKKMLSRKLTSSGKEMAPLGLDLRDDSNSILDLFRLKESHPMSRHVPSFAMRKSSSSHKQELKQSSVSEWTHDPSFALVYPRPSSVPRFDKMTNRQPMVSPGEAQARTSPEEDPDYRVLRPRSLSPVRISKQVDRESQGGVMQKTGAGGLHGLDYCDGVRQAQDHRSASPDFEKAIGREKNSILDRSMREVMALARSIDSHFVEPYSLVGLKAYREGKESGEIWHPKDNVQIHRVRRVSLDSNARSRDEANKVNSSTGGEADGSMKFRSAFVDNILQKQR